MDQRDRDPDELDEEAPFVSCCAPQIAGPGLLVRGSTPLYPKVWKSHYDRRSCARLQNPNVQKDDHVHICEQTTAQQIMVDSKAPMVHRSGCCLPLIMDTTGAKHAYDSLSICLNDLQKRGYTTDLEVNEKGLLSRVREEPLDPEKFTIDEFYRFEGASDPADMSIVYAISSEEFGLKGTIVNAFGTYASSVVDKMVSRLDAHANYPK